MPLGDYENELFTKTRAAIKAVDEEAAGTANMKGEMEDRPAVLPFVYMTQIDNPAYPRSATFDSLINHMQPTYEIQVFTSGDGKKARAKKIMRAALDYLCSDGETGGLGFQLLMDSPITNAADPNIHRRVARVQGVIGENKIVYWR